mgnify:CR=1 FL=1
MSYLSTASVSAHALPIRRDLFPTIFHNIFHIFLVTNVEFYCYGFSRLVVALSCSLWRSIFDRFSMLGIIWFTRPKFVWWIKAKLSLATFGLEVCSVDTLAFSTQCCMVPFCFHFVVLFVNLCRQGGTIFLTNLV